MKIIISTILVIFIISLTIFAQTSDFQMVKTPDGMIVVNNNKTQRFSFLVAGKNPKGELDADGSISIATDSVEGLLIFCIPKSEFPDNVKISDELEMLSVYRQLNVLKLEQIYQAKVNVDFESKGFVNVSNLTNKLFPTKIIPTIYWSYVAPTPENTLRSLFQTVVIGDRVLVIATIFPDSIKLEQVKAFFKETFESIALLPPQKAIPKKKPVKGKVKRS